MGVGTAARWKNRQVNFEDRYPSKAGTNFSLFTADKPYGGQGEPHDHAQIIVLDYYHSFPFKREGLPPFSELVTSLDSRTLIGHDD